MDHPSGSGNGMYVKTLKRVYLIVTRHHSRIVLLFSEYFKKLSLFKINYKNNIFFNKLSHHIYKISSPLLGQMLVLGVDSVKHSQGRLQVLADYCLRSTLRAGDTSLLH